MNDIVLELDALRVGYDGRAILPPVDLSLRGGEIIVLIGPNGGGKSTLLKTIAGQLKPLGGRIRLLDADISAMTARDRALRMATVLTERVDPELTDCFSFVAAGRYPHTGRLGLLSDQDKRAVREAMQTLHCEDLADREIARVSDGQRQRLMLARALCQEPQVMLLDEPTSYLDIRYKLELMTQLRAMARERDIGILISMHEIDLAQRLADRVLCVSGEDTGRALPPEDAFAQENIERLYDLPARTYDPIGGGVELPRITGTPRALVLSSGTGGTPIYRRLQREGIPFAAGILHPGEMDWHYAHLLAAEVIEAERGESVGDAARERLAQLMRECERVYDLTGEYTGR